VACGLWPQTWPGKYRLDLIHDRHWQPPGPQHTGRPSRSRSGPPEPEAAAAGGHPASPWHPGPPTDSELETIRNRNPGEKMDIMVISAFFETSDHDHTGHGICRIFHCRAPETPSPAAPRPTAPDLGRPRPRPRPPIRCPRWPSQDFKLRLSSSDDHHDPIHAYKVEPLISTGPDLRDCCPSHAVRVTSFPKKHNSEPTENSIGFVCGRE
jgi:hypothetical protein